MLEVFKLLGTIGIDNKEANDALKDTEKQGQSTGNKLTNIFKKMSTSIGNTFKNMGKKLDLSAMSKQFNAMGAKINTTLSSAVKTGAKAMAVGGAAAMAGAGALLVKSMNIAGELEQNMGGSEAVFGKYATNMQKIGTTAFKTMGLSQSDFLASANKMGSLYQGVGFSVQDSMNMSSSAMQRASDVASIMGLDIDSAMEAVGGMAKGNFEMMDNLGVAMNDTAIGNYALSKGIKKSTADMSTQEKVGLATQMFMEKTAKYAGNYAKENDTLAGSLQTAKGALGNFMAGAGSIDDVITAGMDFAEVAGKAAMELAPKLFNGISKAIQTLIPQIPSIVGKLASGLADFIGETFGEDAKAKFEGLTDTLAGAFDAIKAGLDFVIKNKDIFTPIAVGIGIVVAALSIWNTATTIATAIQTAFNAVMALNPLALIVIAITAVVTALVYFFTQTETGKAIWEGFMTFLSDAWTAIKDTAVAVWTAVADFFVQLWEGIKSAAMAVWTPISEFLTTTWDAIKLGAETVFNAIAAFFSTIWEGIKTVFTVVVTVIAVIIGTAIELWKNTIGAGMQFIWDKIKAVWDAIAGFLGPIVAKIGEVISSAWNAIKNVTSTVFNAVKNVVTTVWNAIKTAVSTVVNAIASVISTVFNTVKNTVSTVFNAIKSVATTVWNGIKSAISTVVNGISSTISNVFNAIKGTVTTVWNGIKNAIMTPINAAKDLVSKAINAIKGFFNFKISWPHIPMPHFGIKPKGWGIGDLLKGKIPSLDVDFYAKGGIMNKATAFGANGNSLMVGGEAGKEAILPLNRETLGGIGRGIAGEMEHSQGAVVSKLDELIGAMQDLLGNRNLQVVLDSGELVGGIEDKLNTALGQTKKYDERGR